MNARPCFALLRCGLLFSALAGVSLISHAAANVEISVNGNTKTLKFPSNTIGGYSSSYDVLYTPKTYDIVSTSNSVPAIKSSVPIPITDNKNVIIDVEAKVKSGPQFSDAVLKFGKLLPVVSNVIAAAELVDFLKDTFASQSLTLKNNNGQLEADIIIDGFQYGLWSDPWTQTNKYIHASPPCDSWWPGSSFVQISELTGECRIGGGSLTTLHRLQNPSASTRTVTEQEIADKIASASGWPSSAAPLIRKMLQAPGVEVPTDPASTATSGPSSVPGQKTTATESVKLVPGTNTPAAPGATQTDPGTKTTTTTSTTNITYQGDKVIYNTTNNTTTNITNNTTNITTNEGDKTETTEDQTPPEQKEPEDPCKFDPERIGCSKYGDPPEPGELPKKDKEISITPVDMGGPGACPAPIPFSVFGQSYALSYQPACDVAVYLKTLVLLMASVIAGYVFVGGLKS